MTTGKFTAINESFICRWCAVKVLPLKKGCRNHCPRCLSSQHLDIYPGDRASACGGKLTAIGYETSSKKGIILKFRCLSCGFEGNNRAATDDPFQPDDYEAILQLTPRP